MSHNFTSRDGMFTVREPAWHNLQTAVFPDYPTREEAQRIAHNWEPVTEPVYRRVPIIEADGTLREEYQQIEGHQAVARSDNSDTLGVVSSTYEVVSNQEMYDIAEAIEGGDPGSVQYETGGSLKGGKKVWLLLRLAEPLLVAGDPNGATIPYYALQNAHDGSGSFRGQALMTRIVCDNTAQAADLEAKSRGTEFTFQHTKNVKTRIEEAREALAGWRQSIAEWQLLSEHLVSTRITPAQRREFVERFVPMPVGDLVSDRVKANIETARGDLYGILAGPTCEGINLTAYGLVQASLEYSEHYRRAHSQESLFQRSYLDRSRLTTGAMALVDKVLANA